MIDTREDMKKRIGELINRYDQGRLEVGEKGLKELSEANVRQNYIDPFFEILGWDVRSDEYYSEKYVPGAGFVDVAIKIDKKPVIFVEAKRFGGIPHYRDRGHQTTLKGEKICVDWTKEERQVLHYADADIDVDWAILTNFEIFRLFNARTGKIVLRIERPKEYLEKIDDILLLTKENVENKNINKIRERIERKPVDLDFLNLMNDWRLRLARDIHKGTGMGLDEIKGYVQRILDRFVIIRYAEDRWVLRNPDQLRETYEYWDKTKDYNRLSNLLKGLFVGFNTIHDSKIFDPDPDLDSVIDHIDNEVLGAIINELYGQSFRKFTSDILGNTYETYLGHELYFRNGEIDIRPNQQLQKAGGIYYTPTYVVEYIVNSTIETKLHEIWTETERLLDEEQWDEAFKKFDEISKIRVVDPACGSGSFLIKAFDLFECYYEKYIDKLKEIKEQKKSVLNTLDGLNKLPPQIIKPEFNYANKILEENLYGVDLDPAAAEIATVNLILRSIRRGEKLPPILGKNIRVGNSLISGDESELHEYFGGGWRDEKPFNWEEEFKTVFDEGGFDFVIGNPPYVRQELIVKFKSYFQKSFITYHGVADLYVYFIEKGVSLLKNGGAFGIIVANKWMRANYGKPLRQWLKQQRIEEIIDFDDLPVFEGTTIYPCIIRLERKEPRSTFFATKMETVDFIDLSAYVTERQYTINQTTLDDGGWSLADMDTEMLLNKVRAAGVALGEYVDRKIYYGIKTGLNDAFIIDSKTKSRLIAEDSRSAELIKPFLIGKDIKKYKITESNRFVIFTRHGTDISQYPAIQIYLTQFKDRLMPKPKDWSGETWNGRKAGSYEWYEIQDSIDYHAEFEKPKIIWGNLCIEPPFAFDEFGYYVNNPACILISCELYLLGLLNSTLLWYFLKQIAACRAGGFIEAKPIYVKQLPIAPATPQQQKPIIKLVDNILILNKQKQAIFTLFQDLIKKFDQDQDLRSLNDYYTTERSPSLDNHVEEVEKRYSTNRYTMNIVKSTEHIDHHEAGRVAKVECAVEDSYLVLKVKLEGENEFKRLLGIYFEDALLKEFFVLSIKSYLAKNERKRYWSKEKLWEALVEIMIPRSVPNEIADVRNIKRLMRTLGAAYNDLMGDEFRDSPVKELDLCGIEKMIEEVDSEIDQKVYELYGLTAEEIEIVEGSIHHE